MKTMTAKTTERAIKKNTYVIAKIHTLENCAKLPLVRVLFRAIKFDQVTQLVQALRDFPTMMSSIYLMLNNNHLSSGMSNTNPCNLMVLC